MENSIENMHTDVRVKRVRNLWEKNDALPLSPPRQEHRFPFLELGSLSADEQK